MADGLPESSCVAVTIAPNGKVVVRHVATTALSELDGYNVGVQPAPPGRSHIYESPGGQLWTVTSEGLQEIKNGSWVTHTLPEIAAEFRAGSARLMDSVPLCPVRQGLVLIALTDNLIEYHTDIADQAQHTVLRAANQSKIGRFTGMISSRDGGLWLAGERGLAKAPSPTRALTSDTVWQEFLPPESLMIGKLREPHEDSEGVVTLVAESSRNSQCVVVHFDGEHWTAKTIGDERIRHAWRGPEHTVWAITQTSLLQGDDGSALAANDDIVARQYYDVAVEPSGNFWLATSDGLFHYSALTWRTPPSVKNILSLVHCLADDKDGQLWFFAGNSLHSLQNEKRQDFPFPDDLARRLFAARALFRLKDGSLLVDAGDECFKFHPRFGAFTPISTKERVSAIRPLGLLRDGNLCVQIAGQNTPASFHVYDGLEFQTWPDAPRTNLNYSTLLAAQNGDLWLGGEQGVAWRHEKRWKIFVTADKSAPVGATCFAEMADGKIWCAGQDRIWEFDGRSWSGIRQGFDRINGMLRARDGSVWVASNSGLHRFFQNAWVENGMEDGLPSAAVREIYEDEHGVWAGTTHGLSLYHPDADPDPPQTKLQDFKEAEKSIPEGGSITVRFSGQDKWKFTPRSRLVYSGRLDEHDWSAFQEVNGITLSDQPAGKHVFQVRAMDRNCRLEADPARLEFVVIVPWYKESRLLLISFAGGAVALFFAGLAVNRHRRLVRSYAEVEKKVADRTRELEIANRELMHSQKMTALGTLAAGIAHDFNNILSIIKGSAQIIEDNLDNPAKVTTRVERIKTVVEQGAGIVKAMLGFSRHSDSQIAPCDLNEVARDTIKLLGDRFLREVQVTFEPTSGLPLAPGSKDFIQQILLNFIFNAAESMAKRKQVILATQRLDALPKCMVLAPAQAREYVAISVRDFGCGITPENMPRIFDPFFTTKALSVRRGTGLGLSMVYELAKKMEAGLAVESVVDQGSVFTLILSMAEAKLK
jgi:signal transduction histidine kinase/ligand-binding sensor domain-containing protein